MILYRVDKRRGRGIIPTEELIELDKNMKDCFGQKYEKTNKAANGLIIVIKSKE